MKKNISQRRMSLQLSLGLAAAVAISMLAILYFFPRENKPSYAYELNRPWHYAPLIAEYDFPIYKTEEEMRAEVDSAMQRFRPFYTKDDGVAGRQVKALRADYHNGRLGGVPAGVVPHLAAMLEKVYGMGVLAPADYSRLAEDDADGIRLVEGQEALPRDLQELYSTRSAYEYIMHADTVKFPREVLTRCNLDNYLTPNLLADTAKTNAARAALIEEAGEASGMVQSGQKIIDRGEIVNATQYKILRSLERENERVGRSGQGNWLVLAGQAVFVLMVLGVFLTYLNMFRRDYFRDAHSIYLLFSLITFFPVVTSVMVAHSFYSVYLVPYAIVPIFARVFLDSRTAFLTHLVTVVLSSLPLHTPYQFLLVQMVAGLIAIYGLRELTERAQLLRVAVAVTLGTLVFGLAFDLTQGADFASLDRSWYVYVCINGVLLLFAYPLLYLIERLFGFTSSVSLVELTNINTPILRHMSKYAQGTFVHSMQVANLAAEVADRIGAKPQLVRTGALYHDIGKLSEPYNFTENQTGQNPHEQRSEEESARIIINHVTEGLRLADKYHLPKVIRDFIRTHHGRSRVRYFYIQWVNKHPGEPVPEEAFTYPGPNPTTREQAILMMCDAVEASSRSLREYTEQSISELVERIIDGQVAEGYFRECPITFRDISETKRVLVEALKTVYHTRIAYPELQKEEERKNVGSGFEHLFRMRRNNSWGH